jgi:hypothetical protein
LVETDEEFKPETNNLVGSNFTVQQFIAAIQQLGVFLMLDWITFAAGTIFKLS